MRQELYAANLRTRREAALLRSGGQCENMLTDEDGNAVRCPNRIGVFKISRAHNACFEQLHLHHPNGDPENPAAEVLLYCSSCHMKMHRKPGTNGKVPPRKQGYQTVTTAHLLNCLAGAGFSVWPTAENRIAWRIGALEAEAFDVVEAIAMAFHWLGAEIEDLQAELVRARSDLAAALSTTAAGIPQGVSHVVPC